MIGIGGMGEAEPVQALWFPTTTPNTLNTTPPAMAPGYDAGGTTVRAAARVGPRRSDAELAALQADQSRICQAASDAAARNSPATEGLMRQCAALRAANFAKGVFVSQTTPVDPHYRVQLTEAGDAIIAGNASLAAARSALPEGQRRGFTWGVAVARGSADAGFLSFLFPPGAGWVVGGGGKVPFDPLIKQGFDVALRQASGTRGGSSEVAGLPSTAVLVGGGAVVLGVLGAVWYKFFR